ncbi:hypothetical protein L6164_021052 [Bauhinia variegata]|uniref:Uncharacterized protein n=1 Tax=Bauhinia variegata TaxID=167791 RepID=A0ACB9MXC4_BAUVA|nr:hypothetical protein L6164_021052 [Bauhinia variegata]
MESRDDDVTPNIDEEEHSEHIIGLDDEWVDSNEAEGKRSWSGFKDMLDLTPEEILELVFDSEDKACQFYWAYAKCHGFAPRKGEVSQNSEGEFVMHQLDNINVQRHNELTSDFKTMFTEPVISTPLYKIELGVSKIYMMSKFYEVKEEIERVGALNVVERMQARSISKFKLNIFGKPQIEYRVVLDTLLNEFERDCRLLETRGVPYCNIFCAMRHEHMDVTPSSLICRQWTKATKIDCRTFRETDGGDTKNLVMLHLGAMSVACNKLCSLASENDEDFSHVGG